MRTKKVVGDKTTEFYYSGNLLVAQYDGTHWIKFIYAPDGEVVGFTIHDDQGYYDYCYYLKNIQGDIIGIYSNISQLFREYTYDAWGNVTGIYDEYGRPLMFENDVALFNPLRYRGYYYDTETELYYLNSRYYNPKWGSFISADAITAVNSDLLATNIYAYCFNNPVNFDDLTGYYTGADDLTVIFVGALCGLGSQIVTDIITGTKSSGEMYLGAAVGGGFGGLVSLYCPTAAAAVSSGLSTLVGEGLEYMNGKSDKTIDQILLNSCLDAGMGMFFDGIINTTFFQNNGTMPKMTIYNNFKNTYNKQLTGLGQPNKSKNISQVYSAIGNGFVVGMIQSLPGFMFKIADVYFKALYAV